MSRALFIAAITLASPAFAQASYFANIPDLPLPPGFSEAEGMLSFESERGRIVLAEARGAGDMLAVRDFYIDTLPQLGWATSVEDDALIFLRGRERLHFSIERVGEAIHLRVQLAIAPASMESD